MYISTLYEEKNRLRPLPLPSELSKRIWELNRKQVLLVGYELRDVRIDLPWLVIREMKNLLLDANEREVKEYLGLVLYDFGNMALRLLLPSLPGIMLRDPKKVEINDKYIDFKNTKIKVRRIVSTGFWIYPPERATDSIGIEVILYDIPDELDAYNHSRGYIIIALQKLLHELNIRWDLSK